MPIFTKNTIGIFLALATALILGLFPPAVRAIYADGGNASFVVLVVTLVRAISLVGFCSIKKQALLSTRTDIKNAIYNGFMQAISILSVIVGLVYLPGPVVIILIFTHTLMLLFYMAWRNEIKLNTLIVTTTLCALIGLACVVQVWQASPSNLIGIIIVLIGATATAGRLYAFGELSKTKNPAVIGAETFIFALLFILLYQGINTPSIPATSTGYIWLILACVSQALGTFGMFYSIAFIGSFQYSLLMKLEPIFTSIFSFLLIGEILNTTQYIGIVIVVISLLSYQYYNHLSLRKPS